MSGKIIRSVQLPLLLACGAAVSDVGAVPLYSVTNLGDLPGRNCSAATGINNVGQVVGYSDCGAQVHAFLWDATTGMRDLGSLPPDNPHSFADDVNDLGLVVGDTLGGVGGPPFVWDPVNGMRDLAALIDPSLGWILRDASSVNDLGQVVGYAETNEGMMAYVWDALHGARILDGLPTDLTFSRANDINDFGQIVGRMDGGVINQHAFLWDPITGVQDLGILPGGADVSSAQAINDVSQVVGTAVTERGDRAFLWEDGVMIELGDLPMGAVHSYGLDINNAGQVVGGFTDTSGVGHLFLWDATNGMRDLAELIDPLLGWTFSGGAVINDAAQIAVTGYQPAFCQVVPTCEHALLLTPIAVSEPGGLVMFGLGVAALGMFRRRLH
jgi:probable HAF family extracellular repeat protein